jgi:hypothetical protein
MNGTARRPASAPPVDFESTSERRRSRLDLIEESRRIRDECDDLVRLYHEAVGGRRDHRALDSARRRKALLLLLIEELV